MTGSGLPSASVEAGADTDAPAAFPWPPAAGSSALGAFCRTWWESVFRPAEFFRRMPGTTGTGAAVGYYFAVGMLLAVVELFWQLTFTLAVGAVFTYFTRLREALGLAVDAVSPILSFLFAPAVLTLLLTFVFAVVHATLWLAGGARGGAATTLRVLCYAYGARGFALVPFIGGLVGSVWMVVVAIIGLREAHRTDGWRAALAVLGPVAALFALGVAIALIVALLVGIGMA